MSCCWRFALFLVAVAAAPRMALTSHDSNTCNEGTPSAPMPLLMLATSNPLSAIREGRLLQIVLELNVDILFLTGTRFRQGKTSGDSHSTWKLDGGKFTVFSWGWARTKGSNKAAGVSIYRHWQSNQIQACDSDPFSSQRTARMRRSTSNKSW